MTEYLIQVHKLFHKAMKDYADTTGVHVCHGFIDPESREGFIDDHSQVVVAALLAAGWVPPTG